MKKTTITTLLALGYLALGLSLNASTTNFKELHFPNDTNEISIEVDGVEAGAGLLEVISKIITIGTTEAAKLAEQIAEIEALVEAGTLTVCLTYLEPSYFLTPTTVLAVSNQYEPFAGAVVGAVAEGFRSAKSISALSTYALLATPRKL